ncbi:MAG: hypothetical protein ACON5H_08845 [Akkermansiaceae bacterium]
MALNFLAWALLLLPLEARENWLSAPNPKPQPINQLRTSGNACGPACLLDAFQCGSEKWQFSAAQITGETQQERLIKIIRSYGARPSKQFPKQMRWNRRQGINAIDLAIMANEMRKKLWMGTVRQRLLFCEGKTSDLKHLSTTHQSLSRSLKKGLPPILTIRRMAWRSPAKEHQGHPKSWLTVKRHYLVLTGLPEKLAKNATSFPVSYRDPWGGYTYQGTIRIPRGAETASYTSILDFPKSEIGKNLIRKGEATTLSLSSMIGL